MNKNQNILICGIGGQGVVLAGKIISMAAIKGGYDVKTSEVHGMSQRGGSVSTHIRFGNKIYSPLIPANSATVVLSFDIYETVRYINQYASSDTIIISSSGGKAPSPGKAVLLSEATGGKATENVIDIRTGANAGVAVTSEEIITAISESFANAFFLNDSGIARDLGNRKVTNAVLSGFLSEFLDIAGYCWNETIVEIVPKKLSEINIAAFNAGKAEFSRHIKSSE